MQVSLFSLTPLHRTLPCQDHRSKDRPNLCKIYLHFGKSMQRTGKEKSDHALSLYGMSTIIGLPHMASSIALSNCTRTTRTGKTPSKMCGGIRLIQMLKLNSFWYHHTRQARQMRSQPMSLRFNINIHTGSHHLCLCMMLTCVDLTQRYSLRRPRMNTSCWRTCSSSRN